MANRREQRRDELWSVPRWLTPLELGYRSRRAQTATLTVFAALLGACTYEGDPDLLPIADRELVVTSTHPAAGAADVPINTPIDLLLDVPPDPDAMPQTHVTLSSGLVGLAGTITVDLLASRVRFVPKEALRPALRHEVRVTAGLRGLDGSQLAETLIFDFTTDAATDPAPRPPLPTVSAADIQPIWDAHCTACHAPPSARAGLDLSSPQAAIATLRGVPSNTPDQLRVRAYDHARSALMRKLIGRYGFSGLPMPPEGPPLSAGQQRQIASWIDSGAR